MLNPKHSKIQGPTAVNRQQGVSDMGSNTYPTRKHTVIPHVVMKSLEFPMAHAKVPPSSQLSKKTA